MMRRLNQPLLTCKPSSAAFSSKRSSAMKTSFAIWLCLVIAAPCIAAPATLRYVEFDAATGASAAVVVPDTTLVYTDQLFAEAPGESSRAGDAATQLTSIFQQLNTILRRAGTDLDHIAKLNVY